MWWAFQPFAMQGIYFSFKTSFKIKITPFHLCLLQSHHILREQKPRFFEPKKPFCSTITLTITSKR